MASLRRQNPTGCKHRRSVKRAGNATARHDSAIEPDMAASLACRNRKRTPSCTLHLVDRRCTDARSDRAYASDDERSTDMP